MRKNVIEKMLKANKEFVPNEELKEKVYNASLKVELIGEDYEVKTSFIKKMSLIIAPVIVFIFCCVLIGISLGNERYRSIYIDINPSVEIVANRFDYIVDVNYLNDDAIIEYVDLSLKGEKLEKALNNILDKLEKEGYLENKEMIISVVTKNNFNGEEVLNNIKTKVNDYIQEKGKDLVVEGKTHSEEEKDVADEYKLSPAKYKLIEYILKLDATILLDDLKELTIEDLSELLNTLSGEKIEEILDKPFSPKDEKPFGDVDFDIIKDNHSDDEMERPEPEKHECTEDCPEDCEFAKPEHEKEERPEMERPEPEKHECTEDCPEDCEFAKPEHEKEERPEMERPELEKHECTEDCPEDCEFAKPEHEKEERPEMERPELEKHECTEDCPEDCEFAKPEHEKEERPEMERPEPEKHECTEDCPEDCEFAKPEHEKEERPEMERPELEKHECTEDCPEDCEFAKPEHEKEERPEMERPEPEKHNKDSK